MTVIVSLIATSAPAQIIVPTLVSTQNDNTDVGVGASLQNLTNGSGLSAPVPSGSSLESALAVTHTFSGTAERESWTTRSTPSTDYYSASPMPVFVWDLGQDTPLDAIVLWQYGNSGGVPNSDGNAARTFLLRFNTAAEGPEPLSREVRAAIMAALPAEGALVPTRAELTKLAALDRVFDLYNRLGAVGVKVVDVESALVAVHERSVLLVTRQALSLISASELQAIGAHELAHEYFLKEFDAALNADAYERLRELELMCDGLAVMALQSLRIDRRHLINAATRLTRYNESTAAGSKPRGRCRSNGGWHSSGR